LIGSIEHPTANASTHNVRGTRRPAAIRVHRRTPRICVARGRDLRQL